jgi:predicted HicB family RNase H-like nuclease
MKKRGRPKNPEQLVKKRVLQIRLLEQEKQAFEEAAKLSGISLSSWARERLRTKARRELQVAGKKIPFFS